MIAASVFALGGLLSMAYWSKSSIPIYGIYGIAFWIVAGLAAARVIS